MIKRFRPIAALLAALAIIAAAFLTAPAANAADNWGTTSHGFTFWPQDACTGMGNLHFQDLGYRSGWNQVTLEWAVDTPASGFVQIRPYSYYGPVADARTYAPVHSLGLGTVYFAHWTAQGSYSWHIAWHPASGGVCIDYFAIT